MTDSWRTISLENIAEIQTSGSWGDDPDESPETIPVIRTSDIDAIGNIRWERLPLRRIAGTIRQRYLCKDGDIIVVKSSGSHTNIVTGKCAFYQGNGADVGFTNFLLRVRPNKEIIQPEYLLYFLRSPEILSRVRALVATTTYPNLKVSEYRKFPVHFPELAEQQRIVGCIKQCMERVQEIETLRQESLEDTSHLATSLYGALAQGGSWPETKIQDVILRSRNGKSIRQDNEKPTGFVLSLSCVHDVTLNFDARKPIVLPDNFAEQHRVSNDDVFVSRSNTRELVGLSSVAVDTPDMRLIYPDLLIKLEVDRTKVLPRYLAYALRTPESRRQIKIRAVGTSQSMVKISGERLKDVSIPLPPLDVQESLVNRFDELHDLAFQMVSEMQAPERDHLRKSILRKAFAGEL
ncbi:MAG TPA: restriction endonuclease subunit S [Pirellulaceae bacterium]|nr:restriction endonuclease subunit S [Pirellulaceae bacterium]